VEEGDTMARHLSRQELKLWSAGMLSFLYAPVKVLAATDARDVLFYPLEVVLC
jgi:hypothetical protein